jgi:dihydroceramide fatty acyl 2-hydroxylase
MPRNFGVRRAGVSPAFDLSTTSYFLDFALVPMAIGAIVMTCELGLLTVGLGVLAWTLAEYWIHRLVFHGPTRFEAMHQEHHKLPKDLIGVASWGTFAGFFVVWLLAGPSFCAGFMLGYLAYCIIHIRIHHGERANFSRYVRYMFTYHAGHHRGGKGNFGVTSPMWDYVFRTKSKDSP